MTEEKLKQSIRESRPKTYTESEVINKILNLRETLSDLEHQQWSHWTDYFFKRLSLSPNVLKVDAQTKEDFKRWVSQIITSYKDLSKKEKDADRVWADKVISIILKDFMTPSGFRSTIEKSGLKCARKQNINQATRE